MIRENLSLVTGRIEQVCNRLGIDPKTITLVGVTKYADADLIKEAIAAGLTHIGENKVQEAQRKFPQLGEDQAKVTRHMIGHVQTNKVKHVLEHFDIIQSVDSLKLVEAIDKQAQKVNRRVDILIQVNVSGEQQKFGLFQSEVFPLFNKLEEYKHIRVCGLMTMAPFVDDEDIIRSCFRKLRELSAQVTDRYAQSEQILMKYLSMGMTQDFEIAIEEGSNMVRVGRAIFQG